MIAGRAGLIKNHWGTEKGTMYTIEAPRAETEELVSTAQEAGIEVEIACYNAPSRNVVVGSGESMSKFEDFVSSKNIRGKRLEVAYGFHSPFVDNIMPGYRELLDEMEFFRPEIPIETCSKGSSWTYVSATLVAVQLLGSAIEDFKSARSDYLRFAEQAGWAGFREKVYLKQRQLVFSYVMEAFEKLGWPLGSVKAGQALNEIPHLPRLKKVLGQFFKILRDEGLVHAENGIWTRSTVPVPEPRPKSKELFDEMVSSFPKFASELKIPNSTGSRLAEIIERESRPARHSLQEEARPRPPRGRVHQHPHVQDRKHGPRELSVHYLHQEPRRREAPDPRARRRHRRDHGRRPGDARGDGSGLRKPARDAAAPGRHGLPAPADAQPVLARLRVRHVGGLVAVPGQPNTRARIGAAVEVDAAQSRIFTRGLEQ